MINALNGIGGLKALGPDGMPSLSIKSVGILGEIRFVHEVLNALDDGPTPEDWNYTCVILIPKTKNLESMKDLRPISLCKLVSKVLANRLKQILPKIISQNKVPLCRVS